MSLAFPLEGEHGLLPRLPGQQDQRDERDSAEAFDDPLLALRLLVVTGEIGAGRRLRGQL